MTRKMRLNQNHRKALAILAGCPNGATVDALAMHGITRIVLDQLAAAGLAGSSVTTMAYPRGMLVTRFHAADNSPGPWVANKTENA